MWDVTLSSKAQKQRKKLPKAVQDVFAALLVDMEHGGPVRGDWPNYSKLGTRKHHCHIKKGKPCYVAVWEVMEKGIQLIEVQYVGTHEKAPY